MFPISDDNPTLRTPVMTYGLLGLIVAAWALVQGAGFNTVALASSVCNWGMVPGELTGRAPLGFAVPLGDGLACVVDAEPLNWLTPLTSMFLHGSWGHILGNCLFFWVFGNNVEDSMGRARFLVFYLVCGLVAAGAHVMIDPGSPVPTVGASGAISGVLGAYLVLYPRVRVKLLLPLFIIFTFVSLPAWVVLIYWFVLQVITGLPQLMTLRPEVSGGVAVWAHIGGFVAGMVLIKLFENRNYTYRRTSWRHRLHPDHP
ncbi:rhomboid family intramembrane serine protease [Stigmatella aurantiaca]|uniref:Peptidase, S54 (Rhomboid) family n=1 Tax=Stigmatella aurantiaca (strain DW4/3-1) TaxID=378806 RepID=E3FIM0_STIAD|nr:rhomboid family intramembrane serine protease [Stigmatella aurantiaca]ADO75367.1 Peptidase, S54 (Rhomboid) family [Stigmatella aurantiaca DW4/3-1]